MKNTQCCKQEYHGRCCCSCFWHLEDYSHPWTDGSRITEQRGWVCANPELWDDGKLHVMSGWSEHGMCEVWTDPTKIKLYIEHTK